MEELDFGEEKENKHIIQSVFFALKCLLPIFLIFAVLFFVKDLISTQKSINDFCQGHVGLEYITSIKNEVNDEEAHVYKTDLDVDTVVRQIIYSIPKSITKTIVDNPKGETGVGLFTKKEYAYVYIADNGETFIQVSDSDYVSPKSKQYGSNSNEHYYMTYISDKSKESVYEEYLSSMKKKSNEPDYAIYWNGRTRSSWTVQEF